MMEEVDGIEHADHVEGCEEYFLRTPHMEAQHVMVLIA